jgi:hypothetical protein
MSVLATVFVVAGGAAATGAAIAGAIGLGTVSSIAATAIGMATFSGVRTLVQGGDLGDAFKSAVIGGATSYVGGTVASKVSGFVSSAAASLPVSEATQKIIGNVVGNAVGSGSRAALTAAFNNQNAWDAFKKAGVTGLIAGGVGEGVKALTSELGLTVDPKDKTQSAFVNATNAALTAGVLGKDVGDSFLASLTGSARGALGQELKEMMPDLGLKTAASDAYNSAVSKYERAQRNVAESLKYELPSSDRYAAEQYFKVAGTPEAEAAASTYSDMYADTQNKIINSAMVNGALDNEKLIDNLLSYGAQYDEAAKQLTYAGKPITEENAGDVISTMVEQTALANLRNTDYDAWLIATKLVHAPEPEVLNKYSGIVNSYMDSANKALTKATTALADELDYNEKQVSTAMSDILSPLQQMQETLGRPLTEEEQTKFFDAEDRDAFLAEYLNPKPAPGTDDLQKILDESAAGKQYASAEQDVVSDAGEGVTEEQFGPPTQEEQQPAIDELLKELAPYEVQPEPEIVPPAEEAPEEPTHLPQEPFGPPTQEEQQPSIEDLLKELAPNEVPEVVVTGERPKRGYYDEITGQFIEDENGPLIGPLDETSGTNIESMDGYTYDPERNVWTTPDGQVVDLGYLSNTRTPLTGEEIMRNAGALPGGSTTAAPATPKAPTAPTTPNAPTTPTTPTTPSTSGGGYDMSQLMTLLGAMGGAGSGQQAAAPVQDNSADVQLMEDIFGPTLTFGAQPAKAAKGGSIEDLLKLLRG